MKFKLCSFVFVATTFALMTTTAMAVPIPGLFNTGLDSSGNIVGIGVDDGNYALISGPITTNPIATVVNPGWTILNNPPTSQWIGPSSPGSTPNVSAPGGTYTYELIFDLTGLDETTAQISGGWASDNSSLVRLNGGPGIPHSFLPQFQNIQAFSFPIGSGFVPGLNSLTFEVTNFSSGPTGLHVTDLRGDAVTIPEPATLLLAGLGLVGILSTRRHLT